MGFCLLDLQEEGGPGTASREITIRKIQQNLCFQRCVRTRALAVRWPLSPMAMGSTGPSLWFALLARRAWLPRPLPRDPVSPLCCLLSSLAQLWCEQPALVPSASRRFWTTSWVVLGWAQCVTAGGHSASPLPSVWEERKFPAFPQGKNFWSVLSDSRTLSAEVSLSLAW